MSSKSIAHRQETKLCQNATSAVVAMTAMIPPRRKLTSCEAAAFFSLGKKILRRHNMLRMKTERRRFQSTFGATPHHCAIVWEMLRDSPELPRWTQPYHLLWALLFMKVYASESVNAAIVGGVTEKTFWKWAWLLLHAKAFLHCDVVSSFLSTFFLWSSVMISHATVSLDISMSTDKIF